MIVNRSITTGTRRLRESCIEISDIRRNFEEESDLRLQNKASSSLTTLSCHTGRHISGYPRVPCLDLIRHNLAALRH